MRRRRDRVGVRFSSPSAMRDLENLWARARSCHRRKVAYFGSAGTFATVPSAVMTGRAGRFAQILPLTIGDGGSAALETRLSAQAAALYI
jgi:hypothetical protein